MPPGFNLTKFLAASPVFAKQEIDVALNADARGSISYWVKSGTIRPVGHGIYATANAPVFGTSKELPPWPDLYLVAHKVEPKGVIIGKAALAFHSGTAAPRTVEIRLPISSKPFPLPRLSAEIRRVNRFVPGITTPHRVFHLGMNIPIATPESALLDCIDQIATVDDLDFCFSALQNLQTLDHDLLRRLLTGDNQPSGNPSQALVSRVGAFLELTQGPTREWGNLLCAIEDYAAPQPCDWGTCIKDFYIDSRWKARIPHTFKSWAKRRIELPPKQVDEGAGTNRFLRTYELLATEWIEHLPNSKPEANLVSQVLVRLPKLAKKNFTLRPGQAQAINAIQLGFDTLAVLPTGSGKSLIYQFLSKELGGTALVICPLIALMHDQVAQAKSLGLTARSLNKTTDRDEAKETRRLLKVGLLDILFISPERLGSYVVSYSAYLRLIKLLVVDEAHCISGWGHNFRPKYLEIHHHRAHFPNIPILALTATAPKMVQEDIAFYLGMRRPFRFVEPIFRSNLALSVIKIPNQERARIEALKAYVLGSQSRDQGIAYCWKKRTTEKAALELQAVAIASGPYHASLPDMVRHKTQRAFMRGKLRVITATTAFGMGINKPDVRFVVHLALPDSVEAYLQEIGRAGRDSLEARCVIYVDDANENEWKSKLHGRKHEPKLRSVQEEQSKRLWELIINPKGCRWVAMAKYFGEQGALMPCGICDECVAGRGGTPIPIEAHGTPTL
ncbi:MAG: RecQ family ATP-dependent DNA helicase [Holophaga sp.]|nr:RecQ family ATP-dependent DNA helicase [Holophaga sp.]